MKKKALLIIVLILSIHSFSQEVKETFTINGIIEGDYSGMIYLRSSALEYINDSCLVVNNKFKFNGKLGNPAKVSLSLKATSTVAFFYLENSIVDLTIATNRF
jgi:hypothetical protein